MATCMSTMEDRGRRGKRYVEECQVTLTGAPVPFPSRGLRVWWQSPSSERGRGGTAYCGAGALRVGGSLPTGPRLPGLSSPPENHSLTSHTQSGGRG